MFSLSSWDLVGALPISEESVNERIADGDYRWINRGGVDLMGANPEAEASAVGIERAKALYGSLPDQLKDSRSFVQRLHHMLAARKKYRIAEGELLSVPPTNNKACCLLVLRVPGEWGMAITALNFSQNDSEESLDLRRIAEQSDIKLGGDVVDILSDEHLGRLPKTGCLTVKLPAMTAKTLIIDSSNP